MKITPTLVQWSAAPLLLAMVACLAGCSSPPPLPPDTYAPPPPANPAAPILLGTGASADAASGVVQVDAVDYTNRTCLLSRPDGETMLFKVGPEYPNFDRLRVGDSFLTTVSRTFVAYLIKGGVTPDSITNYVASTMPAGAQPGGVMIRNTDYNAKILVLDYASRRAVLQYGTNQAQEVFVPPGVDLQILHVNDDFFIRTTEDMAIAVTPPTPGVATPPAPEN